MNREGEGEKERGMCKEGLLCLGALGAPFGQYSVLFYCIYDFVWPVQRPLLLYL